MGLEQSKCYELLGVKPGVSPADLKAAYRDLAKVWHPDRFNHDVRLQEKAQAKLKEINEAYEQLISGKTPRPQPQQAYERERPSPQRPSWHWTLVPLLLFGVVFALTLKYLYQHRPQPAATSDSGIEQALTIQPEGATPARTKERRQTGKQEPDTPDSTNPPEAQEVSVPLQAVTTVTVLIDPSSGLRARPDCPTKTRMTYPAGSEPGEECTLAHPVKVEESRVKSIAKRVASPGKWLGSGTKEKIEE